MASTTTSQSLPQITVVLNNTTHSSVCNHHFYIKLDRDNFLFWQSQMLPILRGHDVEGISVVPSHVLHQVMILMPLTITFLHGKSKINFFLGRYCHVMLIVL